MVISTWQLSLIVGKDVLAPVIRAPFLSCHDCSCHHFEKVEVLVIKNLRSLKSNQRHVMPLRSLRMSCLEGLTNVDLPSCGCSCPDHACPFMWMAANRSWQVLLLLFVWSFCLSCLSGRSPQTHEGTSCPKLARQKATGIICGSQLQSSRPLKCNKQSKPLQTSVVPSHIEHICVCVCPGCCCRSMGARTHLLVAYAKQTPTWYSNASGHPSQYVKTVNLENNHFASPHVCLPL